jgi:radical SAM protein with 4Fe4S-binding SPASM domain
LKKFKKIYIEINNSCNLACSFCHPGTGRPKAFMSSADFAVILRQIEAHTDYLCLHVLGEPLLHPELGLLLALCQDHGLRINLSTNGTLLGKQQAMLHASPALRQLNISLHSFEQQSERALEVYLGQVMEFIAAARTAVSPPIINLRLWDQQLAELDSDRLSLRQQVAHRFAAFFDLPGQLLDDLAPGQSVSLTSRIFFSLASRFIWPRADDPELGSRGCCHGLRDHVAILVDGTVVPCCLDAGAAINLGNIHHRSFTEILAGPKASRLRRGLLRQELVEPLCRRCTCRKYFRPRSNANE